MHEIHADNVIDFLRERGWIERTASAHASELGWGVSNVVLRVEVVAGPVLVVKQVRERLRVAVEWTSRLDRIWIETAALRLLGEILEPGAVPRVLFEDREHFVYAMSAAPDRSRVWKEMLLEGDQDAELSERAGALLAQMHRRSLDRPELTVGPLVDRQVFDQLRIDPFYRTLSKRRPEWTDPLQELIDSLEHPSTTSFVHADFSPKNLLIAPDRSITVVDFETAHAGDPSFDVGFFLSHLFLKARRTGRTDPKGHELVLRAWQGYATTRGAVDVDFERRAARHLAACSLARIEGKSPVDYLVDEAKQRLLKSAFSRLQSETIEQAVSE
ncbi:MAG: phosphotransferase [Isosphaeraceae bacterium]|nr:phosphotransferase [Isosphaeraceae bacterium]